MILGSNAARLLISDVMINNNKAEFNKVNLVRVPLRLGFDVFEKKEISAEKTEMIINTIKAYKYLLDAYKVKHFKAAATSAMRDAVNAKQIINEVKQATGITIEVISGGDEAAFIYENHIAENMDKAHSYLYIDVGGGSTELTFFAENKLIFKESFNIGTIRLLKNQVNEELWNKMKDFIKKEIKGHDNDVIAIGSGGNINKVFFIIKTQRWKIVAAGFIKRLL